MAAELTRTDIDAQAPLIVFSYRKELTFKVGKLEVVKEHGQQVLNLRRVWKLFRVRGGSRGHCLEPALTVYSEVVCCYIFCKTSVFVFLVYSYRYVYI